MASISIVNSEVASEAQTRLSDKDCKFAIELCKKARPIKDWPITRLLPNLDKSLGWLCCRKQRRDLEIKDTDNFVKDDLINRMSNKMDHLNAGNTDLINFRSKVQKRRYERAMEDHPYLIFGRGVNGFLHLNETLIKIFTVFSIIGFI